MKRNRKSEGASTGRNGQGDQPLQGEQPLRLLQATLIAVAGALRRQACDNDEELAAVLEEHGIKVLDTLLN